MPTTNSFCAEGHARRGATRATPTSMDDARDLGVARARSVCFAALGPQRKMKITLLRVVAFAPLLSLSLGCSKPSDPPSPAPSPAPVAPAAPSATSVHTATAASMAVTPAASCEPAAWTNDFVKPDGRTLRGTVVRASSKTRSAELRLEPPICDWDGKPVRDVTIVGEEGADPGLQKYVGRKVALRTNSVHRAVDGPLAIDAKFSGDVLVVADEANDKACSKLPWNGKDLPEADGIRELAGTLSTVREKSESGKAVEMIKLTLDTPVCDWNGKPVREIQVGERKLAIYAALDGKRTKVRFENFISARSNEVHFLRVIGLPAPSN